MFWKWHVGGSVNDSMSLGCSLYLFNLLHVCYRCVIYTAWRIFAAFFLRNAYAGAIIYVGHYVLYIL